MVIDFHTHIFPDKLASKAIQMLEKSGNTKAFSDGTLAGLERSMNNGGIDYSVVMPIATKPEQCRTINDFANEVNKKENIYAFGTVHPKYSDWKSELKRIKKLGLKGLKLHPDFQDTYIDDDIMVEILLEAGKLDLPVMVHCGLDISFTEVHCPPKRLAGVLEYVKDTTIIAAHMGGYDYLDESEEYLIGSNVYIDVSFVLGKFDDNQIKRMMNKHNPDKILFGSDSPWASQKETLEHLNNLGISDRLKDKILYKNAEQLLFKKN
ncbi:MAG: TatD family hydrolase [Clostridia bacterium]|nr:TatD family hydrolase [Clostridia bacterium]